MSVLVAGVGGIDDGLEGKEFKTVGTESGSGGEGGKISIWRTRGGSSILRDTLSPIPDILARSGCCRMEVLKPGFSLSGCLWRSEQFSVTRVILVDY